MKKLSMILLVGLLAFSVNAESFHSFGADKSAAIRIYNGYTGTATIVITSSGAGADNTLTLDGVTNTVDGSGSIDTVTELVAAFVACTNSSGLKKLVVDTDCAIGTDSTDGELLSGTYTAAAGAWVDIPWDTSAALHYDVYLQDQNVIGSTRGKLTLKSIFGDPTGTGDVTLNVYVDGTNAWQRTLTEPSAIGGTNNAVVVVANAIKIDEPINLPVGAKSVLIRATRATTATTGILGVKVE